MNRSQRELLYFIATGFIVVSLVVWVMSSLLSADEAEELPPDWAPVTHQPFEMTFHTTEGKSVCVQESANSEMICRSE